MGKADYRKLFCETCVSQSQCGYYRDNKGEFCPLLRYYDEGYHQAEEDLALTWEDMKLMQEIQINVCARKVRGEKMTDKEQFEEVLRQFNELKSKEE